MWYKREEKRKMPRRYKMMLNWVIISEIVEKEERFEPVARSHDPPRWRTDSWKRPTSVSPTSGWTPRGDSPGDRSTITERNTAPTVSRTGQETNRQNIFRTLKVIIMTISNAIMRSYWTVHRFHGKFEFHNQWYISIPCTYVNCFLEKQVWNVPKFPSVLLSSLTLAAGCF